jgi:ATP:cob(I)alamin adenosyltransferase
MKVYTKTGDKGQTSLLSKERVFKDNIRVQAYGTVDEANAAMGLAKSLTAKEWAAAIIHKIQQELISLNADLATAEPENSDNYRITTSHVEGLEKIIDSLEQRRIPQPYFVTPGDTPASAAMDLARTIVRRAERCVVALKRQEPVTAPVQLYLNRLSDLLFVLARCNEQEELVERVTSQVQAVLQGSPEIKSQAAEQPLLNKARRGIAAAENKALEIGVPMVIAVVDSGGNLVAQERMDNALLASIALALDKAYTAVALKMPTEQAAIVAVPGQQLFGINTTNSGRLVIFGGGLPIYEQGLLIGGIGVSGGSVEQDMVVAQAGLSAI